MASPCFESNSNHFIYIFLLSRLQKKGELEKMCIIRKNKSMAHQPSPKSCKNQDDWHADLRASHLQILARYEMAGLHCLSLQRKVSWFSGYLSTASLAKEVLIFIGV